MIRKKNLLIIFFIICQLIIINKVFANVYVVLKVNNEIITNYDLKKEANYLKILNPKINNLDNSTLDLLAKESLTREIIKKKELSKFIDLNEENAFSEQYFKNVLVKLGYKNEREFEDNLKKFDTYDLEEVKFKSKLEIYWNDLIFNKYNNNIQIDKEKLKEKIKKINENDEKELFLSEIVIKKEKNNDNFKELKKQIKKEINENGFDSAAAIYSISNSAKFGGKIGWIKKKNLTEKIYKKIHYLEINEISDFIDFDNNLIIIKIDNIREIKKLYNENEELEKLISIERNKKLENYSMIHFNKIKTNYIISEK